MLDIEAMMQNWEKDREARKARSEEDRKRALTELANQLDSEVDSLNSQALTSTRNTHNAHLNDYSTRNAEYSIVEEGLIKLKNTGNFVVDDLERMTNIELKKFEEQMLNTQIWMDECRRSSEGNMRHH